MAKGYDEGPLSFPPTYKFDPMSDSYDSSDKVRPKLNCSHYTMPNQTIPLETHIAPLTRAVLN